MLITYMMKRSFAIVFFCMGLLLLLEPAFRDRLIFAVSYFDNPKVSYEQDNNNPNYIADSETHSKTTERAHAPEPGSMLLVLSGLFGIIVRFAQRSFERFKRYTDLLLSVLGLTIASPILLLSAIMIKTTSKGPVIYKQERVGKGGAIFNIYKLRTMCVDAEKETGAVWAKKNDTRITPIGRILRKCHIDEIPQFFNVIKGQMSIVGPRPERPEMVRDLKILILDYEKRLQVKPGITGLAQVKHKYDETIADVKKKIKYDLLYIKKMCWLVEIRILAQTFVVALTGKGAR